MAKVSLNQASKDTGVSLPTLSRWRKKGIISAEKTDSGGYLIDTSEYDRINTQKNQSPNMKDAKKDNTLNITTPNESRVLQAEIEMLRERLAEKDALVSDLKTERDDWKKQAQTLLLNPPQKPVERPKRFLGILPYGNS